LVYTQLKKERVMNAKKLIVVLFTLIIGIVGCSKEDLTAEEVAHAKLMREQLRKVPAGTLLRKRDNSVVLITRNNNGGDIWLSYGPLSGEDHKILDLMGDWWYVDFIEVILPNEPSLRYSQQAVKYVRQGYY